MPPLPRRRTGWSACRPASAFPSAWPWWRAGKRVPRPAAGKTAFRIVGDIRNRIHRDTRHAGSRLRSRQPRSGPRRLRRRAASTSRPSSSSWRRSRRTPPAAFRSSRASSASRTPPATKWRGPSARGSTPGRSSKPTSSAHRSIKQLEIELDAVEHAAQPAAGDHPEPAARQRAGRQERRRQRGRAHLGRAAAFDFEPQAALGSRARSSASSTSSARPRSRARVSRC